MRRGSVRSFRLDNPLVRLIISINVVLAAATALAVGTGTLPLNRGELTAREITRLSNDLLTPDEELAAPPPPPVASGIGASFALSGYRWYQPTLAYQIANCPRSLDCETAHAAIREAIAAWDAVVPLSIQEGGEGSEVVIMWVAGEHYDGVDFDGMGGQVAHAAYPNSTGAWGVDGDIHLDDDENWVVHTPVARFPEEVHLTSVVMHEFGHVLGLAHSPDPATLMWGPYTGIRALTRADIAGAQMLYGVVGMPAAAEGPAPAVPLPEAIPTGVSATPDVSLNVRAGPGVGFNRIGGAPPGTALMVLGKTPSGDWLYISNGSREGWVASQYCTIAGDLGIVPAIE
ncbi:MAG: matrixin family metalloprotease [Anaerolineae bacterium]|nr:matrixin family metalloprotease [Anaerolineae bacterium]